MDRQAPITKEELLSLAQTGDLSTRAYVQLTRNQTNNNMKYQDSETANVGHTATKAAPRLELLISEIEQQNHEIMQLVSYIKIKLNNIEARPEKASEDEANTEDPPATACDRLSRQVKQIKLIHSAINDIQSHLNSII